LVFALAFFMAGFVTRGLVDDEDGGPSAAAAAPGSQTGQTPLQAQPTATAQARVPATADDDVFLGAVDAPVTIIEFSDFQCPFCKRFRDQTLDPILQTYEGKVRFVYRDFPISSIHEWAQKAAEAGECADEQGKFWEYHDLIFASQTALNQQLETEGLNGIVGTFKGYAGQLGLDTTAFNSCLDSSKFAQEVQKDYNDGVAAGVTGTPAFYINGQEVIGAQPLAAFQAAIDAALQQTAP
jgi:protein-disulfide isomerase